MDGVALKWFQWEHKRRSFTNWEDLRRRILKEFRPSNAGSLHEQWLAVTQTASVDEYRRKFIEAAYPLEDVPESIMMGQYINGLKDDVKAELRLLNPFTLDQAMDMAGRIEERNRVGHIHKRGTIPLRFGPSTSAQGSVGFVSVAQRSHNTNSIQPYETSNMGGPSHSSPKAPGSQASVTKPNTLGSSTSASETRRLTEMELQERRAKGLCFRCDERWGVGHRCRRKELSVLLTTEGNDQEEDKLFGEDDGEREGNTPVELSLYSIMGITNPKVFKLKGQITGQQVVVMVDSGATHNFISTKLVEEVRIPVTAGGGFGVSMGDGKVIKGSGVCQGVRVKLAGGVTIVDDFLLLGLGNVDLILGIQWLERLGNVTTNWKTHEMRFQVAGKPVVILGATGKGGEALINRSPSFHLEDKVDLHRGSDVMDQELGGQSGQPFSQVYTRKRNGSKKHSKSPQVNLLAREQDTNKNIEEGEDKTAAGRNENGM